jgi:uncharacterized repeat protein (TIGR03803 family)
MFLTLAVFLPSGPAFSQNSFTVVHDFTGGDGMAPIGNLVSDSSGNFYGVTLAGGMDNFCDWRTGCGAVFKLSKTSTGTWRTSVLHRFTDGLDGGQPQDGLVIDRAGNLYGTTPFGGAYGFGVIYQVSNTASGWQETVLYNFQGQADGGSPYAKLTLDASGNLYGTACNFGASGYGTVFRLSPSAAGWTYSVLYNFTGAGDGGSPLGGLIFDSSGNLYGTTAEGGGNSGSPGVVFKLSPSISGEWSETVLHAFSQTDGASPVGSLLFDRAGNLFGVTQRGGNLSGCGNLGCGVAYELSPNSSGGWTETVILTFQPGTSGNGGSGGALPEFGLVLHRGSLYGTTLSGGSSSYGVVFRLSSTKSGGWNETVLHTFNGSLYGGAEPTAPIMFDASGNLFGTAAGGGNLSLCGGGCGTVFEMMP